MKKSLMIKYLKEMRTLLSNPKRWTQKSWARDNEGYKVYYNSETASCFCLMGAAYKVAKYNEDKVNTLEKHLNSVLPGDYTSCISYNDARSHRSVLRLIDKAIAAA